MTTTYQGPARTTYTVSGSLADAVTAIEAREEAGKTVWRPSYTYQQDADGNISSATVTCELEIEMPVWSGYSSATPEEQAEWDRFYAALEAHEQGHVEIVKAWLDNAAYAWFEGKPATDAGTIFQSLLDNIQYQSNEYDSATNHGINEGCTITVP